MGTLAAAVFAGWAAFEAHVTAKEQATATRASVWLGMLGEYAAPDMLTSMRALREFQVAHRADCAAAMKSVLFAKDEATVREVHELDAHRRRVLQFFNKLYVLAEAEVIEASFIPKAWDAGTLQYLVDVAVPIERGHSQWMVDAGYVTRDQEAAGEARLSEMVGFFRGLLDPKGALPTSSSRLEAVLDARPDSGDASAAR